MGSFIYGLEQLRKEDSERVGKKCANLGELTRAGFRVPPGFALTLEAYTQFMEENALTTAIERYLGGFQLDPNVAADMSRYEEVSRAVRKMVEEAHMPTAMEEAIRDRYQALCRLTGIADLPVATRSAGPASHPGQYETFLNVKGAAAVVHNVKKVWSSTFNARSLMARARLKLPLAYDPIGVAVLMMVNAKAAGVMFTINPTDGDLSKIYIESNWGLGESVVAGEVTPDSFLVDKPSRAIVKRTISPKTVWYVPDAITGHVSPQTIPEKMQSASSLSDEDMEWAVDSDLAFPQNVLLLQTRPVKQSAQKKSATDKIIELMLRRSAAR